MALMVGAMTIQGIVPGPQVMQKQPELVWGMIASMWVGNLMLVDHQPAADRNLGAALPVPYRLMFPSIVIFCTRIAAKVRLPYMGANQRAPRRTSWTDILRRVTGRMGPVAARPRG